MEFKSVQVPHRYPEQVKIIDDPFLGHLSAQASLGTCQQPQFNRFIKKIYKQLLIHVLNNEWPREKLTLPTRMSDLHSEAKLVTELFKREQKAVCVDVARAGMLPSQIFFDELNELMTPTHIRQDHIFASRVADHNGQITHTELDSSKIGGDVENTIVLIPDPMGATGSSLCKVIQHYKENIEGTPKKIISAHMVITPEFIKKVTQSHPDVLIYTARLDRGFSAADVLSQPPGAAWDREKGLNDSQYIVPGAGGVGELINNSFV